VAEIRKRRGRMRRELGIALLSLWGLCADKLYKLFFGDDANLKGSSFG
jgi:hypothetical protein